MAWSDVANNQMVSFTNAQSSPFSLISGQSHVTSKEMMTKADILGKYNVNAATMGNYASNQLVPKSLWTTGTVYQSATYSETATRTNCGVAYIGQTYTLTAYAGQFTSTSSQADANNQAIAWVQANKQSYANSYGVCSPRTTAWRPISPYCIQDTPDGIYRSESISTTLDRTNCGAGQQAGTATYTISQGAYTSTLSQADANSKARYDADTYAQGRINGTSSLGQGTVSGAGYATCYTVTQTANSIFLTSVSKVPDLVRPAAKIELGSNFPLANDILVTIELDGYKGGTETISRYFRAGDTEITFYMYPGIFGRVSKDIMGRIISITPASDVKFTYNYNSNWI